MVAAELFDDHRIHRLRPRPSARLPDNRESKGPRRTAPAQLVSRPWTYVAGAGEAAYVVYGLADERGDVVAGQVLPGGAARLSRPAGGTR
jgi:hypothetical protein